MRTSAVLSPVSLPSVATGSHVRSRPLQELPPADSVHLDSACPSWEFHAPRSIPQGPPCFAFPDPPDPASPASPAGLAGPSAERIEAGPAGRSPVSTVPTVMAVLEEPELTGGGQEAGSGWPDLSRATLHRCLNQLEQAGPLYVASLTPLVERLQQRDESSLEWFRQVSVRADGGDAEALKIRSVLDSLLILQETRRSPR